MRRNQNFEIQYKYIYTCHFVLFLQMIFLLTVIVGWIWNLLDQQLPYPVQETGNGDYDDDDDDDE